MITYLPYLSFLIVNTIYLFSTLLYAKAVPKNRVLAQYIVYQLYNQKIILLCNMLNPFQKGKRYFHFEKVYKKRKLPVLGKPTGYARTKCSTL